MLRRWFEKWTIFLHPQEVVLVRVSRGIRKKNVHRQIVRCQAEAGAAGWEIALEALRSTLRSNQMRGCKVEVVLSNHFVRYALVPWSEQLANQRERLAYLRHCFVSAYGDPAKRWDLRMTGLRPDEAALASGIETALLESLRTTLDGAGVAADKIHPYLMVAANKSRRFMPRGQSWFVIAEPGRLCLSHIERGIWKVVRNHPMTNEVHEPMFVQFEKLLARESVLAGDVHQDWPVVLYWPSSEVLPALPGRKLIRVAGEGPEEAATGEEAYRQAMWA